MPVGPTSGSLEAPVLELYRRVYARLTERSGDAILDDLELGDHENAQDWKERLRALPQPDEAGESAAIEVFERIVAGNLEFSYRADFEGQPLGKAVRPYTSHGKGE
jgi:hypothetical protein